MYSASVVACMATIRVEDEIVASDVEGHSRLVRVRLPVLYFSRRYLVVHLVLALILAVFVDDRAWASHIPPDGRAPLLALRHARARSLVALVLRVPFHAET